VGVSTAMPLATNAVVQDSNATPNFQCQGQTLGNCANGVDDDGDTLVDCADPDCQGDLDADGYVAAPCGGDCNDNDAAVNPAATELCTNAKDDECDGLVDCADPDCVTNIDADVDGYTALPCGNDCNDADAAVHPGVTEICANTIDDNCDGLADCADSACMPLSICALPTAYCKPRSVVKFNVKRSARDSAGMKVGVTQGSCDALSVMSSDPTKSLSVTIGSCAGVDLTGDALVPNSSRTVFKSRSASGVVPSYVLKVNCRKMYARVKLRHADLKACVANPLRVSLAIDGAQTVYADDTFTESRDGNGNLKRLILRSSISCAP